MQIEYNFTPDDLLAFSEYHNRRFPAAKRQVWFHRFLPPVLVALSVVVLAARLDPSAIPTYAFGAAIIGIAWILCYPAYSRYLQRREVRRLYSDGVDGIYFGSQTLAVTREGMVHRSAYGEFRVPWSAIHDVRIEPDYAELSRQCTLDQVEKSRVEYGKVLAMGRRLAPSGPSPSRRAPGTARRGAARSPRPRA